MDEEVSPVLRLEISRDINEDTPPPALACVLETSMEASGILCAALPCDRSPS